MTLARGFAVFSVPRPREPSSTMPKRSGPAPCDRTGGACAWLAAVLVACGLAFFPSTAPARAEAQLERFLKQVTPAELFEGAERFGEPLADSPIVPLLAGEETLGYLFLNSDFAVSVGYSGKPIHILVSIDTAGVIRGAKLVDHSEPIVLIGIPESEIIPVIDGYVGFDVPAAAKAPEVDRKIAPASRWRAISAAAACRRMPASRAGRAASWT